MASDKGHPLPKFGEWDVNNPASAEGFTVIFNKARDEKRTSATAAAVASPRRTDVVYRQSGTHEHPPKFPEDWKGAVCLRGDGWTVGVESSFVEASIFVLGKLSGKENGL